MRFPESRMKSGAAHRVPLSDAALAALDAVRPLREDSNLVFPSPRRRGQPMSEMTITKVLRDTGLAGRTTVHGFRSAFRDWAAERTNAAHAAMGLAWPTRSARGVEQAYARSDLIERRREPMDQWARFATGTPATIVQLHRSGSLPDLAGGASHDPAPMTGP